MGKSKQQTSSEKVTGCAAPSTHAQSTANPADILTPHELARRLKVGVGWVYEKSRSRGRNGGKPLPCLRIGRYLRFHWPEVFSWMRDAK